MQFSFNFDSYEKSGKSKKDAIDYLKTLDSYVNFDKLEKDYNNDDDAIFDQLKKANITFRKKDTQANTQNTTNNQNANSSTEDTQNNALNANANSQNTTALNANSQNTTNNQNLNTQINEPEQPLNAKTNQTQGNTLTNEKNTQINAQNTQNEEEQKLAKKEEDLNHRGFWEKVKDDFLEETGAGQLMDLANEGLKKIGYDNKDYVTEDEKTQIYDKALNSARQKIANGGSYDDLTPLEKDILAKKDNTGTKAAFAKEQQRSEIEKKDKLDKKDMDLINSDLGFFNTLFNSDKESKKEWEEKRQSEGIISQDIQKAVNTLKQFDEGSLLKNVVFANKDEELQYKKNLLDDAYKIAELNGFNDVGMDKKGDIYFIKTDADGNEKKYLVNTGFFDNFMNMLNDSKFELAGGIAGALKGAKRGTSPMSKALNSIAGGALGSFAGAAADAKLADMYLNRESDFKKNLDYALQAGLLSAAGDGVMLGLTHGMSKAIQPIKTAVDKAGNLLSERTALGFLKTIPTQNIKAAENVIDEVFTPQMKEDLKAAKESLGGAVNGSDLQNPILEKLKDTFTKKYGANDEKTQKIAKLADIFNGNSLKTRQQDMLDLIRSDKEGTTLSYLLEVAKDDVKIQQNLKNMLNLSTSQVKRNLENLKINPYEIKQIMDDFETGNKNAFKEVENQISNLYDDKMKVVLDPSEYNKIKQEFIDNGVPLEEATPFLRDLENNVFSPDGVTFSKLNNFRKNLNYYIYNKDKTPNFVNSVKKLAEGTLKNEIDKGIDNIFKENPAAYDSIKKLYSSSLQDYAAMKELNESVKRLGLQDAQKSTDEVVDNLIKYAKGQGENGVNNLNKIKNYLGKDNHAFLEMQILNRIFKESMVENERAKLSVLDSDKFLNKVKELVGNNAPAPQGAFSTPQARGGASAGAIENENIAKYALNKTELEKRNALKEDLKSLKDIDFTNENSGLKASLSNTGIKKALSDRAISKSVNNGFNASDHLEAVQDIKNLFEKAHLKQSTEDLKHGDKALKVYRFESDFKDGKALILVKESLDKDKKKIYTLELENLEKHTKPQYAVFTSKEAQDFLNIVEGFHKLYKNDASIAKNFTQTTAQKMGTSIATSAEGAIKQKVIKGAFDPIFRLLPEKIFFGMFSKQIQGGALRYHLKKALSRSLNYNDFKLKLEKELQKTHFNSKTKELLNDLMDNLDQFNKAKEEVLNAKALKEQEAINNADPIQTFTSRASENMNGLAEENLAKPSLKNTEENLNEPNALKESESENLNSDLSELPIIDQPALATKSLNSETNHEASIAKQNLNGNNQIDFSKSSIKDIKHEFLQELKPYFNQVLENTDKNKAYFNLKSLNKMMSDRAISKSVNNGFTREEHLEAVRNIKNLFENSKLVNSHTDNKNLEDNIIIHRYNAPFENANALITAKESLDKNKNKLYTLELELTPRFNETERPTIKVSNEDSLDSRKGHGGQNMPNIVKANEDILANNNKEEFKALKDNESENSHLKEEETQNPQNPIDNTQNNQNVNSQNQPLKTQPQSKIFNQEENENIRNLEKEYREAYNKWESLEAQNRERIDKWNERLEEDNKNIEEGFKSLGVEALKYDAFNHIFSRYGGLGGTGKNIRNIINDLRPHLTEEELKSLKDNEPLIEKIESLGKEALDLNAKIKDYSVLMREKHKGAHIVKEHREEHEAQQRMHKIREDLNDARVKRAYRLKELIEKNEPIRSKEEYNYINEALSDGPLKIMLDKKIKHLNKKMENFLKADEFNQSTTIQANQHLGAGLFGGMINGLSEDENGNLTFNPQDFLKGFAAGGVGSLGMNKALKVIKQNPQLKRNLLNELKKSLSITHGDLAKVYPVFKNTKPFKATKKDKALNIQAKAALRDLQIENMQDVLKNLNINPLPRELNEEEIQGLLKSFDNEKNIKEHLFTRTDAKLRKSLFRLLKDTQNDPQIHYIKNGRDKKLKRYKGDKDEPYFYVLITQDKDKTFITHFKNTNIKYLSRELINADKIIKDAATIETL